MRNRGVSADEGQDVFPWRKTREAASYINETGHLSGTAARYIGSCLRVPFPWRASESATSQRFIDVTLECFELARSRLTLVLRRSFELQIASLRIARLVERPLENANALARNARISNVLRQQNGALRREFRRHGHFQSAPLAEFRISSKTQNAIHWNQSALKAVKMGMSPRTL